MSNATDTTKSIYQWSGSEKDCPTNIVINTGASSIVLSAPDDRTRESPRIDPGDRRQGDYYLEMTKQTSFKGIPLMPLKEVSEKRRVELEAIRQLRTGDKEPDWVIEARKRGAENGPGQASTYQQRHILDTKHKC